MSTDEQTGEVARLNTPLFEIKKWKQEAKLEDVERYFFSINEVDELEDGSRTS